MIKAACKETPVCRFPPVVLYWRPASTHRVAGDNGKDLEY